MDDFNFRNGALVGEKVDLQKLAEQYGTPVYVYSRRTFRHHLVAFRKSFREVCPQIRYSIKSCGNIHLLREVASLEIGADVVSGGELYRALSAGIPADQIVFAGVGKSLQEIRYAVEVGVGCFNIESEAELKLLSDVAVNCDRTVTVATRVNPNVEAFDTPEKTTTGVRGGKFGIDIELVPDLFDRGKSFPKVDLRGLHMHLGSPINSPEPYVLALHKLVDLMAELRRRGNTIEMLNMGGGFAAHYGTDDGPIWDDYAESIAPIVMPFVEAGGEFLMEPGRSISANSGVLLCGVRFVKHAGNRRVAIVDVGMNSFVRPVLYDSFHFIWPIRPSDGLVPSSRTEHPSLPDLHRFDIAGPICESTDYLARERHLPMLAEGDFLCIFSAGAYGMVMASQYNAMPRPPEVLIDGLETHLIRRRETYSDLVEAELSVPGVH